MPYKLSICIPTYNREQYLKEALNSIIGQITPDLSDKIEICICDNASLDNTQGTVESFKKIYPV